MPALATFTDFAKSQSPTYLGDHKKLLNDAQQQSYILGKFIKGGGLAGTLRGGSSIKFNTFFDESSTFTPYDPNDTFSLQNPQFIATGNAEWCFYDDHMSWTDHELLLQVTSPEQATTMYTDLYMAKQQRLWTSMIGGMERELTAAPNKLTMEASGVSRRRMYPIFATLNEQTNGLFNSVTTAGTGGAWTTVQGIDPTTTVVNGETRYMCQQVPYSNLGLVISTTTGAGSAIGGGVAGAIPLSMALRAAWQKTEFRPPDIGQSYFTQSNLQNQMILCSWTGEQVIEQLYQYRNDHFVWQGGGSANGLDMALGRMNFHGIPFVSSKALENAIIYSKAGATTTLAKEGAVGSVVDADKAGPRFYFINADYMHLFMHAERSFKLHPVMNGGLAQPYSNGQHMDVWCNLVNSSPRRHAIVYPTADIWA